MSQAQIHGVKPLVLADEVKKFPSNPGYSTYETLKKIEQISRQNGTEYTVLYNSAEVLFKKLSTLIMAKVEDTQKTIPNPSFTANEQHMVSRGIDSPRGYSPNNLAPQAQGEEDVTSTRMQRFSGEGKNSRYWEEKNSMAVKTPRRPPHDVKRTVYDNTQMVNVRGATPSPSPYKGGGMTEHQRAGDMNKSMIMRYDTLKDEDRDDESSCSSSEDDYGRSAVAKYRGKNGVGNITKTLYKDKDTRKHRHNGPGLAHQFAGILDETHSREVEVTSRPSNYIRIHKPHKNEVFIVDGHKMYKDGSMTKSRVYMDDINKSPFKRRLAHKMADVLNQPPTQNSHAPRVVQSHLPTTPITANVTKMAVSHVHPAPQPVTYTHSTYVQPPTTSYAHPPVTTSYAQESSYGQPVVYNQVHNASYSQKGSTS